MSPKSQSTILHPLQNVLSLEGEVDLAQQRPMRADIESLLRRHPQLIIDLTAVTFIDCTVLGTLLWGRTRAQAFGGNVALVGPCAALSRILELTCLAEELQLYPDHATAEDSLRATGQVA
ncbi:MAG TPA: STAS domain-containing protein [Nocardioidaceae bacterium]|nr:STAS domain-containing protein [Nocardioidaceae bacterium]